MLSKPKLLIVDDEEVICKQLKWGLCDDYEVYTASNVHEAIDQFHKERHEIITLDLNLAPLDYHRQGLRVLQEVLAVDPYTKVIMVTGQEERDSAIRSLQLGAHDYYIKPIDINELKVILRRALYIRSLEIESRFSKSKLEEESEFFGILGSCEKMRAVISMIKRVAKTDISVLIRGESGTGKELVAQAIHRYSNRAPEAFIPIDSGAIPEALLESELFGHEKGAFTDARFKRIGKVEIAHKGTLFFDEIAELPLSLQVKLLRFLQERKIQRVGGNEFIPVDIRVITATNRNLEQEIAKGSFREDVYYRLNEITIEIPPLRERDDDIIFIADHLLERLAKEMRMGPKKLTSQAMEAIKCYSWPGNVRELENKIKRALVMSTSKSIKITDLGITMDEEKSDGTSLNLKEAKERLEKKMLLEGIERFDGNLSKLSKSMGVARSTIYDLLEKYGLSVKDQEK